jgi:hypothetical protein
MHLSIGRCFGSRFEFEDVGSDCRGGTPCVHNEHLRGHPPFVAIATFVEPRGAATECRPYSLQTNSLLYVWLANRQLAFKNLEYNAWMEF